MPKQSYIVHVDMDAFFAAIEQRDNPELRGKPVIVGADPRGGRGRGVVSTCSYEARKYGLRSALPISTAYRRCPQGIFLPVDMEKYSRVSEQIYRILYDFTPTVEPVGIDEAFLDITETYHLFGTPVETCRQIKRRVREETGLTASIGLAPTKMAAKIASDFKKPDGLVEVTPENLQKFLRPLAVEKLWGVGEKSKEVLNNMEIKTIGDLAARKKEELRRIFGKKGEELWELAHGIDTSEVETETEAKSISNETTFEVDTSDRRKIEATLLWLCEKVSSRLREERLKGRTVTLKIRLEGFETYTRARTIARPTNFTEEIFRAVRTLYENFDARGKRVRLLGVKVSNFSSPVIQKDLFEKATDEKKERIHRAVDRIKKRFGDNTIHRAGSTG